MDKIARTEECLPIDVWEFPGFLCDFISVNIILVLLPASRFLVTNHFCVTFVLFKNCLDTSKLVRRYVKREATNQTKFLTTFQLSRGRDSNVQIVNYVLLINLNML